MKISVHRRKRHAAGDLPQRAAAALSLALPAIRQAIAEGMVRAGGGPRVLDAAVETDAGGARLVVSTGRRDLAAAAEQARGAMARALRGAWRDAWTRPPHSGGIPDGD